MKAGQESMLQILSSDEPGKLADVIGQNATFPYDQKQRILEQLHPVKRLELAIELLAQELDILQLESEISEKVQENVNKNQRDYYLREQIHAIREELGEDDSDDENYAERIRALGLPEATEEKLLARSSVSGGSRAARRRRTSSAITSTRCSICRGMRRRRNGWM